MPRFQPKDANTCRHAFIRALQRNDPDAALALLPHLTPSRNVHPDHLRHVIERMATSSIGRAALAILVRSPHSDVLMAATSIRLDRFPDDVYFDHHTPRRPCTLPRMRACRLACISSPKPCLAVTGGRSRRLR